MKILIISLLLIIAGIVVWQNVNWLLKVEKQTHTFQKVENTNTASSFIEQLRQRGYEGGKITIEETISHEGNYTNYIFSYQSDGLKIYGMMNIPTGNGPFSVVVLNHGYFNQSSFTSGNGTQGMADILAGNGYITLASDYRGFGKSENDGHGSRGHRPEYAIDVLNLIASVPNLDKADPKKIGMWGHSMGGEVALRSVEATDKIKALVLWAPTSGSVSENARFYGGQRQPSIYPDTEGASPINYLSYISSPISLHQGLSDTEVDPEWAKKLNEALNAENKQGEYFEYPGQDHNFRNLG